MSSMYPIADSKIYIGTQVTAKGDVTSADFASQVWTEIGGWTNAGAIGDTQEVIEQNVISEGRTRKMKGTSNAGTMENQFLPLPSDPGQVAFRAATRVKAPYAFKIEWGGVSAGKSASVTITNAAPAVITWTGHGLVAGSAVTFSTTGTLPTGLVAGQTYYVLAAGLTANAFSVAETPGGAAVGTTAAGSGTHTARTGSASTDLFFGLALPGAKQGGDANTIQLVNLSIAIDSNIIEA